MKGKIELVDGRLFIEFGLFKTALDLVLSSQFQLKLKKMIYRLKRGPVSVFGMIKLKGLIELIWLNLFIRLEDKRLEC